MKKESTIGSIIRIIIAFFFISSGIFEMYTVIARHTNETQNKTEEKEKLKKDDTTEKETSSNNQEINNQSSTETTKENSVANNSSNQDSHTTTSNNYSRKGYEEIYNEYSQRLRNECPSLSIMDCAAVSNEGIEKMAQYMWSASGTDGQYATYESWANKLQDVYMQVAQ